MSNGDYQRIVDAFKPRLKEPVERPRRRPVSERMLAAYESEKEAPDGCVRLVNLLRVWIPEVVLLEQVARFVQTRLFWWGVLAGAILGMAMGFFAATH